MVQLYKSSSSCRNLTFNGWENTDKLIAMQVTVHSTLHMQKKTRDMMTTVHFAS